MTKIDGQYYVLYRFLVFFQCLITAARHHNGKKSASLNVSRVFLWAPCAQMLNMLNLYSKAVSYALILQPIVTTRSESSYLHHCDFEFSNLIGQKVLLYFSIPTALTITKTKIHNNNNNNKKEFNCTCLLNSTTFEINFNYTLYFNYTNDTHKVGSKRLRQQFFKY